MIKRHHLLIAGTGRAGTSFLVRFFHELGLDTQIGRKGDDAFWDENANAGYEDHVLWQSGEAPYVSKFPWLFESIDAVLADPTVVVDAVVVPIRDLHDAASSRIVLELRNRHANAHQLQDEPKVWEHWAATPGGVIYSLHPMDEARILASGFHRLIERLVAAEIPLYMLAFPLMIKSPEHLVRQLRGLPGVTHSEEQMRAAHGRAADVAKVRIGQKTNPGPNHSEESEMEELDREALRREVSRLKAELADARAKLRP